MPSPSIKLLLAEDDELFRLGLRMRLQQESDLDIVAEAEDGETAVELIKQSEIDLVLLDIGLPGIGGIEACRQIKAAIPDLPILILTSHSEQSLIARLIGAGAHGYCLKGIPAEKLILALRSVASGASWWDQTATSMIQTQFQHPAPAQSENPLTKREQEILKLVALGKSNPEIADELYITPGTVRVHIHAILHKLNVRDRTQAAILALQKHYVEPDDSE
ncbi:response regulator transcription factor [Leptolyngbya sp. NIES-2104]|uniref:response regulator transcription factor n=1 Tax=Leptolyngbya sp. NIES-2104 TaxID=1552121 RepID=UPI0006ECB261|nr:response regulator transcription factor [Leptolyngbya sp. NIES-2104]GAP97852.1 two-component response regulator [Leptolyngbya sp. NIES-2104]